LDEFFDETENHARSRSERLRENSGTSISSPEIIVGGALRSPTQPIDTMLKFTEMDFNVTLIQQMEADISPVVLINRFTVTPEEVDQLLKAWAADAAFLKTQFGCISAQLHRGIGGSCCFINVAVWESVAHFKQAFMHPSFQAHLKDYPPSTVASPHLFAKVAIPNICVAG
jgi:quinol monooxygenase YgiN